MKDNLRIALAQVNCTVGDLPGNRAKIVEYIKRAKKLGVEIIVFPELAVTGYPPEDLLLKPKFIQDNLNSLRELSKSVNDIVCVVGFVDKEGSNIYNAAAVIYNAKIKGVYHKAHLPNYGVFDEKRYFVCGREAPVFRYAGFIFGINICEDIWHADGPCAIQAKQGAGFIININASPYHLGKIKEREAIIRKQAQKNHIFIAYVNLSGGQDELVFDGQSTIIDNHGRVLRRAEAFKEDMLVADLDIPIRKVRPAKKLTLISQNAGLKEKVKLPLKKVKPLSETEEVYNALVLGLKDYITKNGFKKVVVGLSGGIDSSLVAALAVDALGKDNVIAVFMPSQYSSAESEEDAHKTAENLGIRFAVIPIQQIFKVYLDTLEPEFAGQEKDITEENLQARIRGTLLMALSNKFGWIVLATGNKSEMSTGYATLYGDMVGGFAVIKDVPKTLVYKLARYRNSLGFVIPERVLTKAPTAELRPNQKDTDTLPEYETLDPILKAYIEEDEDLKRIVALGFDKERAGRVLSMVDKTEYKRRQSPPGIKITPKAFGRDRRMPITNKYKG